MTLIQYCNFYKHTIWVRAKARKTAVNATAGYPASGTTRPEPHYVSATLAQLSATEVLGLLEKWEKAGMQPVRFIKEGTAAPQVNE